MKGTPSGVKATNLDLSINGQIIASQLVDISTFQQGANTVTVNFIPPTDPDLLGPSLLVATINAGKNVSELDYTNDSNSTPIKTMVLCKVADAGRVVPFHAQSELPWASETYGIPNLSSGTMRQFGCSVTDLYMLFSSYGITNAPLGSPANPFGVSLIVKGLNGEALDPGTLNYAMANYKTTFLSTGSVGFNTKNNPIWPGAAEIARAGYQAQCKITGSCDPSNAPNVVSFKELKYGNYTDNEAIEAVQNEVCSGNPVIMKFSKTGGGQHFMLATGIVWDNNAKAHTLQLNNPGSLTNGEAVSYTSLKSIYPSVIGYVLYHPSSDPSMMLITAPMGVQFIVTDPLGRKTGFDPTTGTTYSEIPGASYGEQSINTPGEPEFTPSTMADERYFVSSSDVPAGSYQVQVFSVDGGAYYLDYRSYDSSGITNDAHFKVGTLIQGDSTNIVFQHVTSPAPMPNATLEYSKFFITKSDNQNPKDSDIRLTGTISPNAINPISLKSDFSLSIGGLTGYQLSLPASAFKINTKGMTNTYSYNSPGIMVQLNSSGSFDIHVFHADLSNVDPSLLGSVTITIDSIIGGKLSSMSCQDNKCSVSGFSN
jgi:hypothetical protein